MTSKLNFRCNFRVRYLKYILFEQVNQKEMSLFTAKCNSDTRLDGKTAIITGSNTGIGKQNVEDFYLRGCRVVMACRDLNKAEMAKNEIENRLKGQRNLGMLSVAKLDLSSLKSVREFVEEILQKEDHIQLLVNNAGIMSCPKALTEDGFEMQFATNYLGHYLLTLLLLPRMIYSAPSRIINVSSVAHKWGTINFDDLNCEKNYSPNGAYCRSKLANVLFTKELARRLGGENVHVYAVHPGVVKTELGRHLKVPKFLRDLVGIFLKNVEQGSQTQIYCAVDSEAGKETGLYYAECRKARTSARANDMETAKKLWEVSWDLVQLKDFNPFDKKTS